MNSRLWYISFLLIFSIFVSPYFTPLRTLGPDGILRLDQVLSVALIIIIGFFYKDKLAISKDPISILLFIMILHIAVSFVYGTHSIGHSTRVGHIYNIIIWGSYFATFTLVAANFPVMRLKQAVYVMIIGVTYTLFLGFIQIFDIWFSVDSLSTIYSSTKYGESSRVDTIEGNANMYGQLLLLPCFILMAESIRVISRRVSIQKVTTVMNIYHSSIFLILLGTLINIYFTYSRTIFVVLVLGTILFIPLTFHTLHFDIRHLLTGFSMILTGAIFSGTYLYHNNLLWRYFELFTIVQSPSFQIRIERWIETIPVIIQSPLVGHGPSRDGFLAVSIPIIDSGILGWWYHFGLVGVIVLGLIFIYVLKYNWYIMNNTNPHQQYGIVWSLSVGLVMYSITIPVMWVVLPVPRYRRAWILYILMSAMVVAYYNNNN